MSEQTPETSEAHVEPFPPPYILNVDPYTGPVGTAVTVTGHGLASVTKATFTVDTTTVDSTVSGGHDGSVKTTVPSGTPNGNGSVTVTGPSGTSNAFDFHVEPS